MRTFLGRAVSAPVSMSLCISLAALLTACGGGDATDSAADVSSTLESADGVARASQVRLANTPVNQIGWVNPNIRLPAPVPAPVPATGTMSVEWVPPTTSADGLKLGDLAGFHIYYGTASGNYTNTINVASPSTLTYTISGLPSNTYYLVVKAYDTSNNESSASMEVSKAIR